MSERSHKVDAEVTMVADTIRQALQERFCSPYDLDPRYQGNYEAPEGQVWRCGACGRLSRDRYGIKKIDHGWDESCFMHAVLCYSPPTESEIGPPTYHAVPPQPQERK